MVGYGDGFHSDVDDTLVSFLILGESVGE